MDNTNRRLPEGRRISLNVNLKPEIHAALGDICDGNRSAAIEKLVEQYLERSHSESDAA
jgi:metal-responsive CopG/Arc/MetJ family transcriptional regulator